MMRAGLVQLTSGPDPAANLPMTVELVGRAVAEGAEFVLTPEVTNIVSLDRRHQARVLCPEAEDPTLDALRNEAARHGIWLLIGSLALTAEAADGRFVNRSFLIAPDGTIAARYDKIHMFDVDLGPGEHFRESAGYQPGQVASVVPMGEMTLGMTVCYDLRFPHLYRDLAQAGADVLTVPSAFAVPTGRAHWEVLLRARAIETGAYVLASAQCGDHGDRKTYGHSLAVGPWGEVLADGGSDPGVTCVDLDPAAVASARGRVPSLTHDRNYGRPGDG